jgi:hypothetical protein
MGSCVPQRLPRLAPQLHNSIHQLAKACQCSGNSYTPPSAKVGPPRVGSTEMI